MAGRDVVALNLKKMVKCTKKREDDCRECKKQKKIITDNPLETRKGVGQ